MRQPEAASFAVATELEFIEVSPEMTTLLGRGSVGCAPVPAQPVALIYGFGGDDGAPTLQLVSEPCVEAFGHETGEDAFRVIFLVDRRAVTRLGGGAMLEGGDLLAYLPTELRAIAGALRDPSAGDEIRATYRLAKSIELLCETIRMSDEEKLVPAAPDGAISLADTRRVIAARKLIDERWNEKLTLDSIARVCGLNRAKLTRTFREVFGCTVAEALAERRLSQASRLLLTTDLPISSVGYEAGYLSNASFARAFGRHFGSSPSHYRACGLAA
jgi:AraC family transcriptional activator of pyochelin receptor